jgi:hypothetical protein
MVDALMIIINLVVKSMFSCFLQLVRHSACVFECRMGIGHKNLVHFEVSHV